MFKIEIYSARTLNTIPPFEGPARRAERPVAVPESEGTVFFTALGQCNRTISGGAPNGGPARGSIRS
jgi:hypothetical protein